MPIPQAAAPAPRRLLADGLFSALLDAIVDGTLAPGEAVSEGTIAAEAGVSRTPAREALDRLAAIRLIEVLPRRGSFVTPLDPIRYHETLEVLAPILEGVVAVGVRVASPFQRAQIAERASPVGADLFRPDGVFDYTVDAVGNMRIARAWRDLVPHVRRRWNLVPGDRLEGLDLEATEVFTAAVVDGDADPATVVVQRWFDAAIGGR